MFILQEHRYHARPYEIGAGDIDGDGKVFVALSSWQVINTRDG